MGTGVARVSAHQPTTLQLEDTLTCGLLACDADGVVVQANEAACRYLGATQAELVGRCVTREKLLAASFFEGDGTRVRRADLPLLTTLRTGEAVAGRIIGIHRPDGDEWVVMGTHVVRDPETAAVLMVVATFFDVTGAWQNEHLRAVALAELRAQRDFSEAIVRSSAVLLAVDRPAVGMAAVSDLLVATSGYQRQDLLGKDFVDRLVTPAWAPEAKKLIDGALKQRQAISFECPLQSGGGRELLVEWSIMPMGAVGEAGSFIASGVEVTERRASELAVQASEARYRGLFEDAPIALFEEDESGAKALIDDLVATGVGDVRRYCETHPEFVQACVDAMVVIDANKAAVAMYGAASKEELVGDWAPDWAPEDYAGMLEMVVAIADGRTHLRLEEEDTTVDGRSIHIVETWAVLPGSEQTYDRVLLADIDTTEQVVALQALGQSEQRYRSFVENFHGIAFRSAVDFVPAFMHGSVEEITGYAEAELLAGRPRWDEIVLPEDRPAKLADAERVNGEPGYRHEQDYRIVRKDGAIRWVHEVLETVGNGDGAVAYVQGALYDVTASRAAEEALLSSQDALLESEQLHRALFMESPVGIYVFDSDGIITECNDRFVELFNSSRNKLLGFSHFSDSKDRRLLPAVEAALRGEPGAYEGAYIATTSGVETWISLRTSPLYGADGAISGGAGVFIDLAERHQFEEHIRHLGLHDNLTDLPNRELFKDRLRQALTQTRRNRQQVAVAALNIDRFRNFNDTLGREAGDKLLQQVAERLVKVVRDGDTVARPGGDQFLLLLPGIKQVGAAVRVTDKIMEAFGRFWDLDGQEFYLTPSVGIALFPGDGNDPEALLSNAEAALRGAKKAGRNTCRFFDGTMNAQVSERVRLENDLHRALKNNEFVLHYQPQVEAAGGRIVGVEALVRWNHPERGLVSPLDFIPVAEETGLIVPIGEWVLRTACRQVKRWADEGCPRLRLAVNLSSRQFQQLDLAPTVAAVLDDTGLEPGLLELEITETLAMHNVAFTARVLADLRTMGVGIALDDFGTGFSSLSHLSGLPITTLKIDRAFVADLDRDRSLAAIAAAVITLGHQLGLGVVAEGTERSEEVAFLQKQGCDLMQGFYFSKPLPADALRVVLDKGALPV